jgi:Uma2 family endonuclease
MPSRLVRAPTDARAFIAWESARAPRYELVGGEVRLMAGGNRAHDLIAVNLMAGLRRLIAGAGCDVHGSNLKVVSPVGMVTYPDLFVRCGSMSDDAIVCDDPVVIVEILSPSTRGEDLVRKRWGYQAIGSLRQLVYVDAATIEVEVATRADAGRWWSQFLKRPDQAVALASLGVEIRLAEIYAGTSLEPN